jgi:hypothetical protein
MIQILQRTYNNQRTNKDNFRIAVPQIYMINSSAEDLIYLPLTVLIVKTLSTMSNSL